MQLCRGHHRPQDVPFHRGRRRKAATCSEHARVYDILNTRMYELSTCEGACTAQGDRAHFLLFMGSVSAAVYAIVACLRGADPDHTELFHIYYQPLFVMLAMLWLWGVDVRLFEARRIAYGACFSPADQAFLLTSQQIFQVRLMGPHYL